MIRINVDCNYNYLGPSKPVLSEHELKELGASNKQRVIAYQDDDEWCGTIRYDETLPENMKWYIELD